MYSKILILFLCSALIPMVGQAAKISPQKGDIFLHHSNYCAQNFARQERKYGIPKHLLAALALTESGRLHKQSKRLVPWPWTVNVEGKGSYYNNKHDAITAVNRMQADGKVSIDIGCMQINLKHHPKAFSSIQQGFTPEKNIEYSAKYLRSLYKRSKSWETAVAHYHSKTPSRGKKYFAKVKQNWKRAIAYAGKGGSVANNIIASSATAIKTNSKSNVRMASISVGNKKGNIKGVAAKKKRKAPSIKVIEVKEVSKRASSEVLIIRPAKNSANRASVQVASANVTVVNKNKNHNQEFVMGQQDSKNNKAKTQNNTKKAGSLTKKGPKFIFY